MTDAWVLQLERLPSLLAAFVLLGLAALLLRIDFETRLHRAFAFLLVLKAFFLGLVVFAVAPQDAPDRIRPYFAIAIPFAAVYFALVFHAHYAPSGRPHRLARHAWLALLSVAAGAFLLMYAVDKSLYFDGSRAGSLSLFNAVSYTAFAGIALMFGRLALKQQAPNRRSALMLGAVAFSLEPLHQATRQLLSLPVLLLAGADPFPGSLAVELGFWSIWAATFAILVGVALAFLVGGRRAPGRFQRDARRSLLVMLLPVSTAFLAAGAYWSDQTRGTDMFLGLNWGVDALWILVTAGLIAYAVLHHRFLDSPRQLGKTVRTSTVVGVLVLVFFVAKELLEELLVEQYPLLSGVGAAVVAVALLHPTFLVVGRLLRKVLPAQASGADLDKAERLELYRSQVEVVWMDGVVTRKERLLLERMAERLRLSASQAQRIEKEVVSSLVDERTEDPGRAGPAASS